MRMVVAFVVLLNLALPARADLAACQKLWQSGPKTLGNLGLSATQNYEARRRGLGYALKYGPRNGSHATLFFFDQGRRKISPSAVRTEFREATATIELVKKNSGGKPRDTKAGKDGSGSEVIAYLARMDFGGRGGVEYLTVGQAGHCIVKLRYTTAGNPEAADRNFARVRSDLLTFYNE